MSTHFIGPDPLRLVHVMARPGPQSTLNLVVEIIKTFPVPLSWTYILTVNYKHFSTVQKL